MFVWIAFFFSLLAGVLSGLYIGCCKWEIKKRPKGKSAKGSHLKQKGRQLFDKIRQKIVKTQKPKQETENLLKKKIPQSDITLDEFNCAAEGADYQEYLQKMRKQENSAYKMLIQK